MNTHLKHLEFEAERLERKWTFTVHPWALIALMVVIVLVVGMLSMPLVKTAWSHTSETLNPPVLFVNYPYEDVVKVIEADGKVLTPKSGDHFYQRVAEIKNAGRYEIDYVDGNQP